MTKILRSVGRGGVNLYSDVITIKKLLNKQRMDGATSQLKLDGSVGSETIVRIELFQKTELRMAKPDGRVDPGGKTMAKLTESSREVKTKSSNFGVLSETDFQNAAKALGDIEVAMIKAFAEVESGGRSGFSASGFPKIAYEGHIFRNLTKRAYDKTHPLLSYRYVMKAGPEWKANNKNDAAALETLKAAIVLDRSAAYQACSWGMFQVMGFNYMLCGFNTVDAFVESMKAGEAGQLKAFVGFCVKKAGLKESLASKDFVQCAKLYNGDDYGDYDKRISKAYKKYSGG